MRKILRRLRKGLHQAVRSSIAGLPRDWRFAVYRSFVDCDPSPSDRLELKIAETREELEACLIRESALGFPLQSIFDLSGVRQKEGNIAEISALAVHPDFRKTGGMVLFPLMKFMREYCSTFFDTRHIVIAVNPNRIEMYESLLFFERLTAKVVENYDFANGAPAVGATLDLKAAPEIFKKFYQKDFLGNLRDIAINQNNQTEAIKKVLPEEKAAQGLA